MRKNTAVIKKHAVIKAIGTAGMGGSPAVCCKYFARLKLGQGRHYDVDFTRFLARKWSKFGNYFDIRGHLVFTHLCSAVGSCTTV